VAESEADFRAHGITVDVQIGPGLAIAGNKAHFDSILKNLILNARDALADKNGKADRMIRVECLEERRRQILRVSDNGTGIPAEDRTRIFEPFFSTKPSTGTGLGLAVVRKLVSVYQGTIEIESELGRGTTFEISFPR
jgi:signal transduction histidine kinase